MVLEGAQEAQRDVRGGMHDGRQGEQHDGDVKRRPGMHESVLLASALRPPRVCFLMAGGFKRMWGCQSIEIAGVCSGWVARD